MSEEMQRLPGPTRPPRHLWVVGLLLVLWNGWGVALAIAAQSASLPFPDPDVAAYFAAQPSWLVLLADIGPVAGVAGSVALLLQSRWAPALFAAHLAIIVLANAYEVAVGSSLLLGSAEARAASLVLVAMILGEIVYARRLARRGVLY